MTVDQIPISRFSIITRISPKALRYYDQKGLLVPQAKDPITGYRYYTADQLERGVRIKTLCNLGFSLEEMASFLEAEVEGDGVTVEALLEEQLAKTQSEITRLQRIEALLKQEGKEMMKMALIEPTIKEVPALRVLSRREKGALSATIGKTIGDLMAVVFDPKNQRNQVRMTGPLMTLYHEEGCTEGSPKEVDCWAEKEVDIEVAVPVVGRLETNDPKMELKSLAGTKVLSVVHKGSYETLHMTYRDIFKHMMNSRLEIAGPIRELYLNDPTKTPAEELMTEIQVPIKG
ncbi:MAG TPA: MerR family transcriptional regulator [Methanotrichaceae archaeon]|nr:MerR family transcriptional regulator [Methanotrichaceae archaeon]